MKRTTFIWVILTLLGISVVLEIFGAAFLAVTRDLSASYGSHVVLNVVAPILLAADIVLTAFFWTKLWALKENILRWSNLYFGWSIFRSIFAIIADIISDKGTQLGNIVELVVIAAVWALLYRHLKIVMSPNAPSNGMNSKKALLLFGGIILAVLAFYAAHTACVMSTIDGPASDKESKEWVDAVHLRFCSHGIPT